MTIRRMCRGCGCTDNHACVTAAGPCTWVLLDIDSPTGICSVCAAEMGWDPALLAQGMCGETAAALTDLSEAELIVRPGAA